MSASAHLGGVPVGGQHPVAVMGAVNVSPESFYGGSIHRGREGLVRAALAMAEHGAALIDVGARSSAPYLPTAIDEEEERARLVPAIEALAGKIPVPISADTARAEVARAALDAGARIINDVSGLRDPAMGALVRARAEGVILMASPDRPGFPRPPAATGFAGAPEPRADPVVTVRALLTRALERARAAGIPDGAIVLDPGIGFFRDTPVPWDEWDVAVLAGLSALAALGRPLALGVSRKSFLGAITGRRDPAQRLAGSLAAAAVAVLNGAALIRTHDVAETLDAVRVAERLRRAQGP
jgi:dihydropteroate synthase